MLAHLNFSATAQQATHLLVLFNKSKNLPTDIPQPALLKAVLKRRNMKADELAKSPLAANTADGALVVWAMVDAQLNTFSQHLSLIHI